MSELSVALPRPIGKSALGSLPLCRACLQEGFLESQKKRSNQTHLLIKAHTMERLPLGILEHVHFISCQGAITRALYPLEVMVSC